MSHYGFIGLGQMGYKMAGHLYQKSKASSFTIFDVLPVVSRNFVQEQPPVQNTRLSIASEIKEIGKSCNVIITMVPTAVCGSRESLMHI